MGAITFQITSLTIVYSIVYSLRSKKTSKHRVTALCAGNSPGTGEFPAQMASNAKMFPFDDVIMNGVLFEPQVPISSTTFRSNYPQTRFNSLWPSDAIWGHRTGSVNGLTTLMHDLNQCWLIISKVPWQSSESITMRRFEHANRWNTMWNCI